MSNLLAHNAPSADETYLRACLRNWFLLSFLKEKGVHAFSFLNIEFGMLFTPNIKTAQKWGV